jgi:hypothetical protein
MSNRIEANNRIIYFNTIAVATKGLDGIYRFLPFVNDETKAQVNEALKSWVWDGDEWIAKVRVDEEADGLDYTPTLNKTIKLNEDIPIIASDWKRHIDDSLEGIAIPKEVFKPLTISDIPFPYRVDATGNPVFPAQGEEKVEYGQIISVPANIEEENAKLRETLDASDPRHPEHGFYKLGQRLRERIDEKAFAILQGNLVNEVTRSHCLPASAMESAHSNYTSGGNQLSYAKMQQAVEALKQVVAAAQAVRAIYRTFAVSVESVRRIYQYWVLNTVPVMFDGPMLREWDELQPKLKRQPPSGARSRMRRWFYRKWNLPDDPMTPAWLAIRKERYEEHERELLRKARQRSQRMRMMFGNIWGPNVMDQRALVKADAT